MALYKQKLQRLQQVGLLRRDLPESSLDTLMHLSGLARTFFLTAMHNKITSPRSKKYGIIGKSTTSSGPV